MKLRCRKCRQVLLNDEQLLTAHGKAIGTADDVNDCVSVMENTVCFLQEDTLPSWITTVVDKDRWMKGKLHCPGCNARVGAFDFISGMKCDCGKNVLPAVHLVRSKVDSHS